MFTVDINLYCTWFYLTVFIDQHISGRLVDITLCSSFSVNHFEPWPYSIPIQIFEHVEL